MAKVKGQNRLLIIVYFSMYTFLIVCIVQIQFVFLLNIKELN